MVLVEIFANIAMGFFLDGIHGTPYIPASGRPHGGDPQDPRSCFLRSLVKKPWENPILKSMIAGGSHIFLGKLHEKLIELIELSNWVGV